MLTFVNFSVDTQGQWTYEVMPTGVIRIIAGLDRLEWFRVCQLLRRDETILQNEAWAGGIHADAAHVAVKEVQSRIEEITAARA